MIKRIAPSVDVIDITHGITAQQVLQGALVLANALPYMPVGVHVAVVDPGVGGERTGLVLRGRDGRLYVGPDNGLLTVAADRLGGVEEAVEIANADYVLRPVSRTFHGRDVFSPVAAHLALGVPLAEFGPPVATGELERLEIPAPEIGEETIVAAVLYVDRFGNVQLNLTSGELAIAPGARVTVDGRHVAVAARTFADVAPGELVVYEDSYGAIALAVNRGSAAEALSLAPGQTLTIGPA